MKLLREKSLPIFGPHWRMRTTTHWILQKPCKLQCDSKDSIAAPKKAESINSQSLRPLEARYHEPSD
ncbi:hypothetical protein OE88DRAFT_1565326 [Heliocybe sulcata]|uniref:Uncharacterized protein n=1 Tax=Heliocybe sulcata TaxID=5364 RepID=A0A5C3N550_9AGAM|nr:hypothetical protein OE88DRAFT_1565326 [Heliocybe sulcata]